MRRALLLATVVGQLCMLSVVAHVYDLHRMPSAANRVRFWTALWTVNQLMGLKIQ